MSRATKPGCLVALLAWSRLFYGRHTGGEKHTPKQKADARQTLQLLLSGIVLHQQTVGAVSLREIPGQRAIELESAPRWSVERPTPKTSIAWVTVVPTVDCYYYAASGAQISEKKTHLYADIRTFSVLI